jgi:uncharacterized protein
MTPLDFKFRVEEVPFEGRDFIGTFEQDAVQEAVKGLAGVLGYEALGPATAKGTIYRTSSADVIIKGTLEVTVQFDCARCLETRALNAQTVLDHMMVKKAKPTGDASKDEALVVEDDLLDEPDIEGYQGDSIDLTSLLREDLVLAMPMNPTCDDAEGVDCAPLADTQAEEDTIDPRWAPLLELKKKMN